MSRGYVGSMQERLKTPRNPSGQQPSDIDRRVAILLERGLQDTYKRMARLEQDVARLQAELAALRGAG